MWESCRQSWNITLLIAVTASVLGLGNVARAAGEVADKDWHMTTSLGFWGITANGTLGLNNQETDVDTSLGDIINHTNVAINPSFELSKDKWVINFNGIYAKLSADGNLDNGIGWDATSDVGLASLTLGYTILKTDLGNGMPLILTPAVGARYNYLTLDFQPDGFRDVDKSRNWVDPYIGARVVIGINQVLRWRTEGTIGGANIFGGSNFVWSAASYLDWRFSKNWVLNVGYRVLYEDYDHDNLKLDLTFQGPWIGISTHLF